MTLGSPSPRTTDPPATMVASRPTVHGPPSTLSGSGLSTLRSPLSDLWQVPVFLVGSLALLGVWLGRPSMSQSIRTVTDHRVQEARKAIEPGSIDAPRALALAREL